MASWKRLVYIAFVTATIINLLLWIGVLQLVPRETIALILHYNIYLGPDLFGQWYQLFWIPATGLTFILVNGFLSRLFWRSIPLLNLMLATATVGIQVGLGVAFWFILSVNRVIS